MKLKCFFKSTIFFLTIVNFLLTSCNTYSDDIKNALDKAGNNKKEIEKIINFYKHKFSDNFKYKAAIFLVENMPFHSYREPNTVYDFIFDSVKNIEDKQFRKKVFFQLLDSISQFNRFQQQKQVFDIKSIDSDFIINNIEIAFKAWEKIPKEKRASFDDFCNFILPYRSSNEPLEKNTRSKLSKKYSWVNVLLNNGASLKFVVDSVKAKFDFLPRHEFGNYYRSPLSLSQIEKSRLSVCDDGVNYLVNVFRSVGIVSAKETVYHWGNNPAKGHSWFYVKYGDEEYSAGPEGAANENLIKKYKGACIPKIYRRTYKNQPVFLYSPFGIDITHNYISTVDIKIENKFNMPIVKAIPVLCVFDINKKWDPVSFGKINKKGDATFVNVGHNNILYMAAFMHGDNIEPINYPFVVNSQNQVQFFKPSDSIITSAVLTRKIGLSTYIRKVKLTWINRMNKGVFEVANNPKFTNAKTVHKISNFNSTHTQKVKLDLKGKYKFVRYKSNQEKLSWIAELSFYDKKMEKLNVKIIDDKNNISNIGSQVFDEDPLTFFVGENLNLNLKFDEPKFISTIEFQPRNDDNHINAGEHYELFYWDKKWKTLGRKVAKDTVLYYDTPKNALLWLRNLTKGKEEHVFTIDKKKKQKWIGFDNY